MTKPQLKPLEQDVWGVSGDLTFATVAELLPDFSARIQASGGRSRFDLGEVTRADSAGLALLLEGMALAREAGGEVEYRNLPESLRDLARISNVAPFFDA